MMPACRCIIRILVLLLTLKGSNSTPCSHPFPQNSKHGEQRAGAQERLLSIQDGLAHNSQATRPTNTMHNSQNRISIHPYKRRKPQRLLPSSGITGAPTHSKTTTPSAYRPISKEYQVEKTPNHKETPNTYSALSTFRTIVPLPSLISHLDDDVQAPSQEGHMKAPEITALVTPLMSRKNRNHTKKRVSSSQRRNNASTFETILASSAPEQGASSPLFTVSDFLYTNPTNVVPFSTALISLELGENDFPNIQGSSEDKATDNIFTGTSTNMIIAFCAAAGAVIVSLVLGTALLLHRRENDDSDFSYIETTAGEGSEPEVAQNPRNDSPTVLPPPKIDTLLPCSEGPSISGTQPLSDRKLGTEIKKLETEIRLPLVQRLMSITKGRPMPVPPTPNEKASWFATPKGSSAGLEKEEFEKRSSGTE